MTKNEFRYVTLIKADIEKVWDALTLPEFTERYWHRMRVRSDWQKGDEVVFLGNDEDGSEYVGCKGTVVESERPKRLAYSWLFPRLPECQDEEPSLVAFDLEEVGGATKLSVTHNGFADGSKTFPMITEGWPVVLSNLKTLLETGEPIRHDLF